MMRIEEIQDKSQWENFLKCCQEKTFLQSFNWGEFQKAMGEKVWRWGVYDGGKQVAAAQVIKIKARRGTFLFLPHGPLLAKRPMPLLYGRFEILEVLLEKLRELAKQEKAVFIRIAPLWQRNNENKQLFKRLGFYQAPLHIHPENTWQLNITKQEEELLMNMRKTTRYLIRQGLKNKDLKIIKSKDIKDLKIFNQLYKKTAKRHKFIPFSFEYLKKEFEAFLTSNEIALFLAKYKREFIAGAIIVFWQERAFYHHGASLKKYPKIPASYLLQWKAILEAKKRGCKIYNFWGIADLKKRERGKGKHPWAGLTLFKQGFGGFKKEYLKTQDFIISQRYWLNFLIEKIRKLKRGY